MKTIKLSILLVLVSSNFMLFSQTVEEVHLKVITYNIWNGHDWGKDIARHDKMVHWINSKKPDVVALQELCGYTEEKLASDAKLWGCNSKN
jgi:exodeoxyribonuclease-3